MNKLQCRVLGIDLNGGTSFLKLDFCGHIFSATSLSEHINVGDIVWAYFKSCDVILARSSLISTRNKFSSKVLDLKSDNIFCRVCLEFGETKIYSLVSVGARDELDIEVGSELFWCVKSNEILLGRS